MTLPSPLPDMLAELIADRLRAIGEPMRIKILDRLRGSDHSVQELTDALGTSQQNVSKHLGVLHRAGIVSRSRDGNRVRYAIADTSVIDLCESVCGGLRTQLAQMTAAMGEVAA